MSNKDELYTFGIGIEAFVSEFGLLMLKMFKLLEILQIGEIVLSK
ncbi:hypothetical protein SAG0066_01310 [Streptococcus agalactiae CCUG 38383]|nr:hypothetical protein SAG0066_01310 [Streptococcus agalactiae CCUG 38383]